MITCFDFFLMAFRHNVPTVLVGVRYDDVVEEMLLDSPKSPYLVQCVLRCFP